uniref:SCP domain-containing protein n=1 Tax=Parastrongyloides trichosuri TaxID=131310 RepID=A0A0N4ZTA0_PARTI
MSRKVIKYSSNTPKTVVIKKIERRTPQGKLLSVVNMKATYYEEKPKDDECLSKVPIFVETEKIPLHYPSSPVKNNYVPIFVETEKATINRSPFCDKDHFQKISPSNKIIINPSKYSPSSNMNREPCMEMPVERTEYILTETNTKYNNNRKSVGNDSLLYGDIWSTSASSTQVRDSHIIRRKDYNSNNNLYDHSISQGNIFDEYVSALNRINHYRIFYYKLPSYAKLVFSEKLMKEAKNYCYEKLMCQSMERHGLYETNVWKGSANFLVEEVIDDWFNEMKFWKESNFRKEYLRYLGIGIIRYQRDNTPMMLVACLYE